MAEIGIDPSWEYGQFKSGDGGTEMRLHQGENSWMQRQLGRAGTREWKITESSSVRAERGSGNARGVKMLQH